MKNGQYRNAANYFIGINYADTQHAQPLNFQFGSGLSGLG